MVLGAINNHALLCLVFHDVQGKWIADHVAGRLRRSSGSSTSTRTLLSTENPECSQVKSLLATILRDRLIFYQIIQYRMAQLFYQQWVMAVLTSGQFPHKDSLVDITQTDDAG